MSELLKAFELEREVDRKLSTITTSLDTLITLYTNAKLADVYCDDFYGMQLLIDWLQPIDVSILDTYSDSLLPSIYCNYEVNGIARLLNVSSNKLNRYIKARKLEIR